jgi:predicted dehydrogenase
VRGGTERALKFAHGMSAGSAHAEWFVPLLREFVTRVRRGDASRGPWDEALAVLRALDACYRSHAEGRTVALAAREVSA